MRTLLWVLLCDLAPMFWFMCILPTLMLFPFFFCIICNCEFHVSFESSVTPRYLISPSNCMLVPWNFRGSMPSSFLLDDYHISPWWYIIHVSNPLLSPKKLELKHFSTMRLTVSTMKRCYWNSVKTVCTWSYKETKFKQIIYFLNVFVFF